MSDMQTLITRVFEHAAGRPMWEVMRADEAELGNTVIVPGDTPWLSADDWHPTIIVSQRGKEVRLIAILAKRPHSGAFRRMIAAILDAGLVPVIIAPTNEMRATMKRWNWADGKRCMADVVYRDGSLAQCGRYAKVGTLCTQHAKIAALRNTPNTTA